MNYNSIEEILAAGTTNMTVLRSGSKNDDGVDTITGVDWFTFNGTVASNIYAYGNSYLGFGSSTSHLSVNNRDGALYYLYREEGTLFDYFRFLKIRWRGYSRYNYTSSSYALTYDVILWDTGDISLHMVSIPTSYNTGTYALNVGSTTYTYSVSTASPDVTFKKTDSNFTVSNSVIDLQIPYRFLIKSGSSYYVQNDDAISQISVTQLTANIFETYGTTKIPNIEKLLTLQNTELLCWSPAKELEKGLTVHITPPLPQVIYSEIYEIPEGSDLDKVAIIDAKDILTSITFDEGHTWKYYSPDGWVTSATDTEGMTLEVLFSVRPEEWLKIATSKIFQFRFVLPSPDSQMGTVYYNLTGIEKEPVDPEEPEDTDPPENDYVLDGQPLYLQTNGNQWFDTGITATSNIGVEFKISCDNFDDRQHHILSDVDSFFFSVFRSSRILVKRGGTDSYATMAPSVNTDYTVRAFINDNSISINGTTYNSSCTVGSKAGNGTLIFGKYPGNTSGHIVVYEFVGKIYYLNIYENGTMIRSFVPYINNGVAGMFDTVNSQFYASAGASQFIAGPIASD